VNAPRVGVGALVIAADGRVLLGRRRGAHGAGDWAPPGGHLDPGEMPEACAARETREETGLEVTPFARGPWTNDVFAGSGLHYVTLFVLARHEGGEPRTCEPEKCDGWSWHGWDALPSPLFAPLAQLVASGFRPLR
jgi:8-oxo-dGTP diphosphatase